MRNSKEDWRLFYGDWLSTNEKGLVCIYFSNNEDAYNRVHGIIAFGNNLCILAGPGPRGVDHAVVGRWDLTTPEIVHDPHQSRDGLLHVTSSHFIL